MCMCGRRNPVYMCTCICAYTYVHVFMLHVYVCAMYKYMCICEYESVWLCVYAAGLVYERKCDICLSGSG